jgi:hypothetical protein
LKRWSTLIQERSVKLEKNPEKKPAKLAAYRAQAKSPYARKNSWKTFVAASETNAPMTPLRDAAIRLSAGSLPSATATLAQ